MTIFGVPWDELELHHVEAFLSHSGPEPLTWEAKGTEIRAEHVTKHVGGFANAVDGGYLLLGFVREGEEWRPTGFAFPENDPPAWVSRIVRETLSPRPRIDVQSWDVGDGMRAAVVRVDPVAEPPCMTNGGQVYLRVLGETITVKDPTDCERCTNAGRQQRLRLRKGL